MATSRSRSRAMTSVQAGWPRAAAVAAQLHLTKLTERHAYNAAHAYIVLHVYRIWCIGSIQNLLVYQSIKCVIYLIELHHSQIVLKACYCTW